VAFCYFALLFSQIAKKWVSASMANRVVRLYRTVKLSSGKWSPQPVADRELKDLKDLPERPGQLLPLLL